MHRSALIWLLFIAAGCSDNISRRVPASPENPVIDTKTLVSLNQSQSDLFTAIEKAFPKTPKNDVLEFGFLDDEKVSKMSSKLDPGKGNCEGYWIVDTATRYEKLKVSDKTGKRCPVQVTRLWETSSGSNRVWTFNTKLFVRDPEFLSFLPIFSYEGKGDVQITDITGGLHYLGHIKFTNVKVSGYDDARMTMDINQVKEGPDYSGSVSLRMVFDGREALASIRWSSTQDELDYTVNGVKVVEKDFAASFSSYGLDKVMDRMRHLLYSDFQ